VNTYDNTKYYYQKIIYITIIIENDSEARARKMIEDLKSK